MLFECGGRYLLGDPKTADRPVRREIAVSVFGNLPGQTPPSGAPCGAVGAPRRSFDLSHCVTCACVFPVSLSPNRARARRRRHSCVAQKRRTTTAHAAEVAFPDSKPSLPTGPIRGGSVSSRSRTLARRESRRQDHAQSVGTSTQRNTREKMRGIVGKNASSADVTAWANSFCSIRSQTLKGKRPPGRRTRRTS